MGQRASVPPCVGRPHPWLRGARRRAAKPTALSQPGPSSPGEKGEAARLFLFEGVPVVLKSVLRVSVFLVLIGGACGGARAAENILGLPARRDPSRPGAVMLHGGGRFTDDAF